MKKISLMLCLIMLVLKISALPISLLSFGGIKKSNSVLLNWRTGSEVSVNSFEIERLGLNNEFVKIGIIKAAGNSSRVISYNFTDFDSLDKNIVTYYRLKIIDFNGNYYYSNVISSNDFKIFLDYNNVIEVPNQKISFNVKDKKLLFNGYYELPYRVINNEGIVVSEGSNIYSEIDINHFSTGLYYLIINDNCYKILIN